MSKEAARRQLSGVHPVITAGPPGKPGLGQRHLRSRAAYSSPLVSSRELHVPSKVVVVENWSQPQWPRMEEWLSKLVVSKQGSIYRVVTDDITKEVFNDMGN